MSRISDHNTRVAFTLVEVMVAVSVCAVVFAGILSAYLFIGQNLSRLVNVQRQEVESRRALRRITQDLSAAVSLTTTTTAQLAFTKAVASGTTSITYTYSPAAGTLTRVGGGATQTILKDLTTCSFTYFNEGGAAVEASPQSVKSIELAFSSAVGSATTGTRTACTTVSPRVVLRNKPALQ